MRFLLVDRIVTLDRGKSATGIKNVTLSEDFFAHHFPGHPIMPGALITECLVQLADWVLRESTDFEQIGVPRAFDRMKFHRIVRPGDQLHLHVEIIALENATAQVRGKASCGEHRVAAGQFTMEMIPAAPHVLPDDSRRTFDMIRLH